MAPATLTPFSVKRTFYVKNINSWFLFGTVTLGSSSQAPWNNSLGMYTVTVNICIVNSARLNTESVCVHLGGVTHKLKPQVQVEMSSLYLHSPLLLY